MMVVTVTTYIIMVIGQRLHQLNLTATIVVAQDKKDSMRAYDSPDMASKLVVVMMNTMVMMATLILV